MNLVNQSGQENDHPELETVVQGNNKFALDLYQRLRTADGNLFFSPYSISTALALTYAGARGNTEAQMAHTLNFTLDQKQLHPAIASLKAKMMITQEKGNNILKIANALWPQAGYPLLEEFLTLTKEHYGEVVTPIDYLNFERARGKINAWVEEKTQKKIRELIPPGSLDTLTRLVLTNAIYFKGNWASSFEQKLTKSLPFQITNSEKVEVPMMRQEHTLLRYGENDDLQILELPYAGGDLAMVVLLPRMTDGLVGLETALSMEKLEKWMSNLRRVEVLVYLPKFNICRGFNLKDALVSMGILNAFDMDKADFSGMNGNNWLYLDAVLHKAFVA